MLKAMQLTDKLYNTERNIWSSGFFTKLGTPVTLRSFS